MKNCLLFSLIILFAPFFWGCANGTPPVSNSSSGEEDSAHIPERKITEPQKAPYYRYLTGHISDDLNISMHLHIRSDSSADGVYLYQQVGRSIELISESFNKEKGTASLVEYDPEMPFDDKVSGRMEGNFFDQGMIEGSWSNADGTAVLPFLLNDAFPEGMAQIGLRDFDYRPTPCQNSQKCVDLAIMEIAVSGIDPAVAAKINQDIQNDYIRFLFSEGGKEILPTLELAADSLAHFMLMEHAEMAEEYTRIWSYQVSPHIQYNQDNILSLRIDYWSYTGGAHGNPFALCYTYDLKTGNTYKWQDFFPQGAEKALTTEALRRLKLTYEGSVNDDLSDLGFLISDQEFKLNNDFFYSPAGLVFVYSPYEIASYAMGFVEVFVPFN